MKIRWSMRCGVLLMILIISSLMVIPGCSSNQSSTTSAVSPASGSQSSAVSTTAAAAPETLKIGLLATLSDGVNLDMVKTIQLMAEMDNQAGGITVGDKKYLIDCIVYDDQNSQSVSVAAVNKLIYNDNVKYIMCYGSYFPSWQAVSESNKVIAFANSPGNQEVLQSDKHYTFVPYYVDTMVTAIAGWFCNNNPDLLKNIVVANSDNQFGHLVSMFTAQIYKAFGVNFTEIYYPENSVDLSSLGTKVVQMNPTVFEALVGQPELAYKAVRNAGYKGAFFSNNSKPLATLQQYLTDEALEGFTNGAWPTEFDPPLTEQSKLFKEAWIAKYGSWDSPEMMYTGDYACFKAALQKAGSIDTDKVAAVIGNGLKYDGPCGASQMISRPDIGNNTTIDSVATLYIKKIQSGKPVLVTTISIEEGLGYMRLANPPQTAASATP